MTHPDDDPDRLWARLRNAFSASMTEASGEFNSSDPDYVLATTHIQAAQAYAVLMVASELRATRKSAETQEAAPIPGMG